jgi:acetyl-CoA carboxylase biotin carboxyl carrier protein
MSANPIDPAVIKALADILTHADLTEIEIEHEDLRIRLARTPAPVIAAAPVQAAAPMHAAPAPAAPSPVAPADELHAEGTITSPMVGVAYLSSEPGSPPFVSPGQAVAAGQTLLLIEAMKTYNQIRAPQAGTVMRILVASGQPVEFGQPLIVIA